MATTTFNGKKVHQGMIKSKKTRVGDLIIASSFWQC